MSSVSFRQAKDAELAWIDGQIHFSSATSKGIVGLKGQEVEENKTDLVPILDAPSHDQVKYTCSFRAAALEVVIDFPSTHCNEVYKLLWKSLKSLIIFHLAVVKD